jgi:hypothetical protein
LRHWASNANALLWIKETTMRKITIVPAVALSLMTMGMIAQAAPASAHHSVIVTGEDGDDATPDTVPGAGGGSGAGSGSGSAAPSGGAATGAGGTALHDTSSDAPWLAAGAAGIALVGVSAATRRRRAAKA